MSGVVVTRSRAPMVRYRSATGEFGESRLDRVSAEVLLSGVPVREFRWFKGRRFYSGWYWSATTGGLVAYESRLELARVLLADFDPAVVAIAAQPFQLSGMDAGRSRSHVPDLLLQDTSGLVTVVDVKPEHRLARPEVQAVFRWTEELVTAHGWAFEVWSGTDAVVLENVRFLAGYRRPGTIERGLLPLVMEASEQGGTIEELELTLRSQAPVSAARPAILHLLWRGDLQADLTVPLAAGSAVWPCGRSVR
ncbi:TnsA-like heteromeric transposase endonuclease subunit [Phytohabitans rumicis]|uniref:TnsA endonuclease N-terminal domain-containing protein n=1 Tax=Phytohabitans rumicis TaxID=1076125 RepID=A0A6V8LLH7_9ACTN|nr:TnsA-like heteromeric transposase endonuclease subunit [Phytohabitans rumicis]GFJ93495.1 hypothetical protein Prum_071370 [Phytohabitans rumicis]